MATHLGARGPIPPLGWRGLMNGCVLGQPATSTSSWHERRMMNFLAFLFLLLYLLQCVQRRRDEDDGRWRGWHVVKVASQVWIRGAESKCASSLIKRQQWRVANVIPFATKKQEWLSDGCFIDGFEESWQGFSVQFKDPHAGSIFFGIPYQIILSSVWDKFVKRREKMRFLKYPSGQ